MEMIYTLCMLIGGLGAFLIGVNLLSTNIEKLATRKLRNLFEKSSRSKLVGVGIGTVTTAIVQSSSATTVMVVGLVNAGVMSLMQATAVMMGANIGTTITAQIAALQSFKFAEMAMGLAGIGIFMNIMSKNERVKYIGEALAGLGLIFIGLEFMSTAMDGVKNNPAIATFLSSLSSPILLLLAGIAVTAIVQSSSAVTTIVVSMVGAGIVIGGGGNSALYIILGTNIGTCVTALLSSVGATTNGKRASMIHLMFNVFGSLMFFVLLLIWRDFNNSVLAKLFGEPTTQIAMFHTIFNVVCTILFLPLSKLFVKIVTAIVPDKQGVKKVDTALDVRLLSSPATAISSVKHELIDILDTAMTTLHQAYNSFKAVSQADTKDIIATVNQLEKRGQNISDYLISLSSTNVSYQDEQKIGQYHHNIGDIVRVAELAENITKYTDRIIKDELVFSPTVLNQMEEMLSIIDVLAEYSIQALNEDNHNMLPNAEAKENEIDSFRKTLTNDHIVRLKEGRCNVANSRVFFNLVSNLERVGDHLLMIVNSVN